MKKQILVSHLRAFPGAAGGTGSRVGRVIRRLRPAIPTVAGALGAEPRLPAVFEAQRSALASVVAVASAGVGRIDTCDPSGVWVPAGTGWVISAGDSTRPARIVTAAHVASALLIAPASIPRKFKRCDLRARPDRYRPARITFADTPDPENDGIPITAILWPHGLWDLMLCELATSLPGAAALPFETDPLWPDHAAATPAALGSVAVLGYPGLPANVFGAAALAANEEALGGGPAGIRRLSPGLLADPRAAQGDPTTFGAAAAALLRHDASTIGGSSGSPVISLATGRVIGVHVRGGMFEDISGTTGGEPFDPARGNCCVPLPLAFLDRRFLEEASDSFDAANPTPCRAQPAGSENLSASMLSAADEARSPFIGAPVPDIPSALLTSVMRDRPDDRDYPYIPALGPLPDAVLPRRDPARIILNQRSEPACVGFAIAALINDQIRRAGRKAPAVSARMLQEMALNHDEWIDDSGGGTSLRAGIKGFYNSGVCSDRLVPFVPNQRGWSLTRPAASEARTLRAGAYYRLRHRIEDFQSAIHEVGAVAISAQIHEGWVRADGKRVRSIRPSRAGIGKHAFIAIGYDSEGFIIQNSWGPHWGKWGGQDGLAHWSYEDWIENLIDGWVVRLAPSAPATFGISPAVDRTEDAGLPAPLARLTRPHVYALLGHIAHVERDGIVERGNLGLGLAAIREAAVALGAAEARQNPHLAILYHDPFLGADLVPRIAAHLTPTFLKNGIFPLHVLYGSDELSVLTAWLKSEAALVAQRFGAATSEAGDYIQRRAVQRAARLWADFSEGAARAARPGGPLWQTGAALCLEAAKGRSLSVISFGAGSVASAAQLNGEAARDMPRLANLIRIAPVGEAPALPERWKTGVQQHLLPAGPGESVLPPYRGDWCDLVAALGRSARGPRVSEGARSDLPASLAAAMVDPALLNGILRTITGRMPPPARRFGRV